MFFKHPDFPKSIRESKDQICDFVSIRESKQTLDIPKSLNEHRLEKYHDYKPETRYEDV